MGGRLKLSYKINNKLLFLCSLLFKFVQNYELYYHYLITYEI